MTVGVPAWAAETARAPPYPLIFTTVSGAQHKLLDRTGELKPALHLLRGLLTGRHLMRTGELETDLGVLGADLPYVPEPIARKREAEHIAVPPAPGDTGRADAARLRGELDDARDASHLPMHPDPAAVEALHHLVVRTRLAA
jgi:hypothetical protein